MVYNFLIHLTGWLLSIFARFSPRIQKWVNGRQNWQANIKANFQKRDKVLWVHVASLGEFEQGRPLIEAFRERHPNWQVVLTFFSPSGYEIRKNYSHADFVAYLPLDTPSNARQFLQLIQPNLAIFVKYEFWKNFLSELKKQGIPTLLVAAIFRQNQPFFKWWGGMWHGMLQSFSHIFVQEKNSQKLLQSIHFQNVTVAGDTRIDRVLNIAESPVAHPKVEAWSRADTRPIFVAGSSWAADEAVFLPYFQRNNFQKFKILLAPHDIHDLKRWENIPRTARFSIFDAGDVTADILLIDNVGMLNTLYRFGAVAYIGGGFGRGIHNILEPAAYGLPVIFGQNFQKFEEAHQLLACGGAFSIKKAADFEKIMEQITDEDFRKNAGNAAKNWLLEQRGATQKILKWIDFEIQQSI